MGTTSIEWTDKSWPVLNGCRRVSEGCRNCYAELLTATRLRNTPKYRGLAVYTENGPRWTGESRLWSKDLTMPLRLRDSKRIFVCDMGDLFYEGNTDEQIDSVFGVMWACVYLGRDCRPGHIFQVLTKRAKRMREYLSEDRRQRWAVAAVHYGGKYDPDGIFDQVMVRAKEPHPNIILMVSAENQETADERIQELLATPAAARGISAEPLLDALDLSAFLPPHGPAVPGRPDQALLDWVICGGESGNNARVLDVRWARSLRDQCKDAGVAFFMKQVGRSVGYDLSSGEQWSLGCQYDYDAVLHTPHRKGAEMSEWPEDLRIREFPKGF